MIDLVDKEVSRQTNCVQFVVLKPNAGTERDSRCAMQKASKENCSNERKGNKRLEKQLMIHVFFFK